MADEVEAPATDPVEDQGKSAKELGLSTDACPYTAEGENRDKWLAGFEAAKAPKK
jgi:ribosome modulation factor